ncbi:MAG TPA: CsbD family protein [Ktedonobacteraceae bacterium]
MSMNEDTRTNADTPGQNSAERDKMEGNKQDLKGRVKEGAGALTGNERLKAQGEKDQLAGTARRKKGNLKDRIKGWVDRQ